MLAVADCLDALGWVEEIGGLPEAQARIAESFGHIETWVEKSDWASFLCSVPEQRSMTSVCLTAKDCDADDISALCSLLDDEGVAYDIKSYKSAPPGIRIWCGATVEPSDVAALLPWLDWAYARIKGCLLYTSPSPRDQRGSRMPSSA